MTTPDHDNELNAAEEAALNEYLRRDSAVSQRYREIDAAAVPPSLDHAVLSQAKAAVATKKISRWRGVTRWSAPLALAASVVVVVSLVTQPEMRVDVSQRAAPVAAVAPAPTELKEEARELITVPPAADNFAVPDAPESSLAMKSVEVEQQIQQRSARQLAARAASTPPPELAIDAPVETAPTTAIRQTTSQVPVAAPPPPVMDVTVTAQRRERAPEVEEVAIIPAASPRPGVGPRGTVPASNAIAGALADKYDEDDPQRWLVAIRQLRAAGDPERADAQWRRFVEKYPDFAVDAKDSARPLR